MISERLLNEANSPWWGEHVHRYNVVMDLLPKNSTVLDLACGTGFGSLLLANASHNVIGGDIAVDAIEYCNKNHQHKSLKFIQMDGTNLPFTDNYFDAIVSFETIEHTTQYSQMLQEFKRALKPNGTAYISTPNIVVNSPGGKIINPYHTQEWNYEELNAILKKHFSHVKLYGQEYSRYPDKTTSFNVQLAMFTEKLLYKKGFRKIPIELQDTIMKSINKKPMYPLPDDFILTSDVSRIKNCKTFFAICKP